MFRRKYINKTKIFFINNNSKRTRLRVSVLGSVPGNLEPRWVPRSQKLGILAGSPLMGTRNLLWVPVFGNPFFKRSGSQKGSGFPVPKNPGRRRVLRSWESGARLEARNPGIYSDLFKKQRLSHLRANVLTSNCPNEHVSFRANVLSRKCPSEQMS